MSKARKRFRASAAIVAAAMAALAGSLVSSVTASADSNPAFTVSPASGSWATEFTLTPPQASCPTGDIGWRLMVVTPGDEDDAVPPSGSVAFPLFGNGKQLAEILGTSIGTITGVDYSRSGLGSAITQAGQLSVVLQCFKTASSIDVAWFKTVTFDGPASSSPNWSFSAAASSPVGTSTTLTVSPTQPAAHGSTETLTAQVSAASGTTVPAGSVEFLDGSTDLASAQVGSTGTATATASLGDGTHSLTAEFTPSDSTAFSASSSAAQSYTVNAASSGGGSPLGTGSESVSVTITAGTTGPGQFSLTVPSQSNTLALSSDGTSAAGSLAAVSVSDQRADSPGWTVSGQAGTFATSSGSASFSGNALGWTPSVIAQSGATVSAGPPVTPNDPGLGTTAATLGSSTGASTATLGANLNLAVPSGQATGTYTSTITITAI